MDWGCRGLLVSAVCGLVEQASSSRNATCMRSTMYITLIWMNEEQRLFDFDCNAVGLWCIHVALIIRWRSTYLFWEEESSCHDVLGRTNGMGFSQSHLMIIQVLSWAQLVFISKMIDLYKLWNRVLLVSAVLFLARWNMTARDLSKDCHANHLIWLLQMTTIQVHGHNSWGAWYISHERCILIYKHCQIQMFPAWQKSS